jgi:hypothetical protein
MRRQWAGNNETKIKRRSYPLAVPLALKFGNMKKDQFFFAGGEYEWTFLYKQKLFIDGEKFKHREWTSDRVNAFLPSVFAGIQLPISALFPDIWNDFEFNKQLFITPSRVETALSRLSYLGMCTTSIPNSLFNKF